MERITSESSIQYRDEIYEKDGVWYKAIYNEKCLKSLVKLSPNKTAYVEEVVFYEDGVTQKMIIPYQDGVPEGTVYVYHRNGRVKLIVPIKDGKKEGNRREYNDAGILIEECYYVANKKNGGYKKYNPLTGRCILQAHYKNDLLDGEEKTYDMQGNLLVIEKFLSGERISTNAFPYRPVKTESFRIL